MSETTFRTQVEPAKEPVGVGKDTISTGESTVEVPYTDYEKEKGHPYSVDHFGLGSLWNEQEGGFTKEISTIEEFLSDKINKGELANSPKAIKEALSKIEKTAGLSKYERPLVKVETVAEYVKFLMNCDKIRFNISRYGNH